MTKKLAGRKQVAPNVHSVTLRFGRLVAIGDGLARHKVQRLPLRHLFVEKCFYLGTVVVLGLRRSIATNPFVFSTLSGLQYIFDTFFVDNCEELLAHLTGLGLAFDFVAIDDATAIRVRAGAIAT